MLQKLNTSYNEIIESFDLILHLETIAKNYPELYNNENNKNRTLNKELAIQRNDRLLEGVSKRVIINAYKDIKNKQESVIEEIEKVLKEGSKNGKKYCLVTTTFDNIDEANKVRDMLMKKRLIASGGITPMDSKCFWKGEIEHTSEFYLQMITKKALFNEIVKEIENLHTYET